MSIQPLRWPEYWLKPTWLQSFSCGTPLIGIDRRAFVYVKRQLRLRPTDVSSLWPEDPRPLSSEVGKVVQEYFRWPNARFIPADPCRILFWDPTIDLRGVEAMMVIEDRYSLPDSFFDDPFPQLTYGKFVAVVHHWTQRAEI